MGAVGRWGGGRQVVGAGRGERIFYARAVWKKHNLAHFFLLKSAGSCW
jgi:hypothetical protein